MAWFPRSLCLSAEAFGMGNALINIVNIPYHQHPPNETSLEEGEPCVACETESVCKAYVNTIKRLKSALVIHTYIGMGRFDDIV